MKTRQKIALGVLTGVTVLAGSYGVLVANAATEANFPPMIQKMVEKFNLNKGEVQKVMDENRVERQAEREKTLTSKLDEAVKSGKITEVQKNAILAKHEEMQKKREEYRNLSQEERRSKMQEFRTEMQNFLKSQGIDESVMPGPQGPKAGMGFGGGMHRGR